MEKFRPYLAGLVIVLIWSGWYVVSRFGVQSELTPADITLLRYITALIVVSPLIRIFPWKKYPIYQCLVVGLGVGFPYTLPSFYGMMEIQAAHAGVLINGMLPVFGMLALWFCFKEKISSRRGFAVFLIFLANIVMTGDGFFSLDHIFGILLLLSAAVVYTFHMVGIRMWGFSWKEVLVVVPVVNTILFIPLWFLFPSTHFDVPLSEILIQSVYQGVVVNIIALACVAYVVRKLGTMTASLYMSFVPVTTAIFAWIILGEQLTYTEIGAIAGCTFGLMVYSRG